MKRLLLTAILALAIPAQAADFADTDTAYMFDVAGTAQYFPTWTEFKAELNTSLGFLPDSTTVISAGQASAITANTAKTGITTGQADAITANTAKVSFPEATSDGQQYARVDAGWAVVDTETPDLTAPGPIGGGTPSTAVFTTVTAGAYETSATDGNRYHLTSNTNNPTVTCVAGLEGSTAWNATTNLFKYCNGSAWVNLPYIPNTEVGAIIISADCSAESGSSGDLCFEEN